jgi:hypothetical protein
MMALALHLRPMTEPKDIERCEQRGVAVTFESFARFGNRPNESDH